MKEDKDDAKTHLVKHKEVKGTPFTVSSLEAKVGTERLYYVMFGKYRLTEDMGSMKKAVEEAKVIDWFKMMGVCHGICEMLIEEKELRKLSVKK